MSPAQQRFVVVTAALGMFVSMLTSIPMTITVPTITAAFGEEVPTAQWIMTAYFVAQAATMLPIGSAGDILGRARVFVAGYMILIPSLLLTTIASSIDTLILLRVLQGVGAGMMLVTAPAICTSILPPSQRGRAIALVVTGGWLAAAIGQPVFGTVAQYLPWQGIFMVVVAPAVVGLLLSLRLMSLVPQRSGGSFDFIGASLMVVTFGTLVIAAGHGQQEHWEAQHTLTHVAPLFLISILAGALYIVHAQRASNPIIPLGLFRNQTVATATATNTLLHMTMLMIAFMMPFYLQNVLGYAPAAMALFFVPMSIALNLMAFPSGWVYDKLGSRLPCTAAMVLGAVLLLSFTQLGHTSSVWDVFPRLVLSGVVLGLFVTPNISALLGAVPREHHGLMSGVEQASRNIGHAMGVVLSSAVAAYYLQSSGAVATAATYVSVVHTASVIAGVMMGAGAVLAWMRREPSRRPLPQPQSARSVPEPQPDS